MGVLCCNSFKALFLYRRGGLYPKVVVLSQDMSDSRAGLHLFVKIPFLVCVSLGKISLAASFLECYFIFSEEFVGKNVNVTSF